MSSSTPINRNRFITVFDTDAERLATPPNSIPFGQFVYSLDTKELRIADGTAVWPAPVGGGGGDGTLNLARLASLTPLPLTGVVALIDGVAPVAGNIIAAFGQAANAGNGLYVYNPLGAWPRSPEFSNSDQVKTGSLVVIQEGATNTSLVFEVTTSPIPPGPLAPLFPLAFVEVAGPFSNTAQPVGAASSGGTSELISRGDHVHKGVQSVSATDASIVVTPVGPSVTVGVGVLQSDAQHGLRGGGLPGPALHPDATALASGFQSSGDKIRQDRSRGGSAILGAGSTITILAPPGLPFDPAGGFTANKAGAAGAATDGVNLQITAIDPGGLSFDVTSFQATGAASATDVGVTIRWTAVSS
jgi:hypothetical protein